MPLLREQRGAVLRTVNCYCTISRKREKRCRVLLGLCRVRSSNIAIRLKCHGYNVTYTQGSESLDWALRDAQMLLKSGRYKTVLVGMHDETTPFYRQAMEQLGVKDLKPVHSVAMVLSVDNQE